MTIQPLTGILIGIALLETLVVMLGWHRITRGGWHGFPAGRVLMGLLGTQAAILTLAAASSFFPGFAGRPYVYIILYLVLIGAVGRLGYTIFTEQRRHHDKPPEPPKHSDHT